MKQETIKKTTRRKGYTILEVIIAMAVLAVLMSMLMPVLAQARNRALRLKCQNNVKQINVTFITYASENEVKFPWMIVDVDKKAQGIAGERSYRTDSLYGMGTIRTMLGTSRTLLSPCDPDRGDVNDQVDLMLVEEFPDNAASYGLVCGSGVDAKPTIGEIQKGLKVYEVSREFDRETGRLLVYCRWAKTAHENSLVDEDTGNTCREVNKGDIILENALDGKVAPRHSTKDTTDPDQGADFIRGTTMLVVTRNIVGPINNGDSLSNQSLGNPKDIYADHNQYAYWLGSENHSGNDRTMAGLTGNQGQVGLADGSAHTTSDNMLTEFIRTHHSDDYGLYAGVPSPIIDTPNEPDPYPVREARKDRFGWRWNPDLVEWERTDK